MACSVVLTTEQQRAWLNWCNDTDTGNDLLAALKVQRNARASELKTGSVIAATSAVSHSVSFSAPEQQGITPYDLFTFWGAMVDLFVECEADLDASTSETITDDDVLAEMLFRMTPVRSVTTSYVGVLS